MQITFSSLTLPKTGTAILFVDDSLKLSGQAKALDDQTKGQLASAIKKSESFKGNHGETLCIALPNGTKLDHIVLFGIGKVDEIDEYKLQTLGGKLYTASCGAKKQAVTVISEISNDDISSAHCAALVAYGANLRSYRFDTYLTRQKDEEKPSLNDITFAVDKEKAANEAYESYASIADGVYAARDVVTEPPNILYPESYANRCKELEALGVEVEVLNEKAMEKLGMGALLGVGQGSIRESQLVIMKYFGDPDGKDAQPVAFVGKGVTFDSGGISLKPSAGMEDMKYDMAGSAAVFGVMKALAGRKAKVNAVGIIGLVENMPGHNAQRPSDIVSTMSGQTVEVLNTDAEGRLVLSDALWYTQDKFNPKFMVNLATLTGAIVIALGDQFAGLFSNNDELCERLTDAGEKVKEKLWRFPLTEAYDNMLKSEVADMQNISPGRGAGSITAAQFLQRFVNDVPWAHLDIAGVAWNKQDSDVAPKGATGFGVRLLDRLVKDYYEN